ncbi:MAG: hypothetical protein ACREYE_13125 [Gammaproteobacteria bacterium]
MSETIAITGKFVKLFKGHYTSFFRVSLRWILKMGFLYSLNGSLTCADTAADSNGGSWRQA